MAEAEGKRNVISPRNAPPTTTVYHKSESAPGSASDGVSKVTRCPKIWESTFCVEVSQASNHAFNSGLSWLPVASVITHLPALWRVREKEHERRGRNSLVLASLNTGALPLSPGLRAQKGFSGKTAQRLRSDQPDRPRTAADPEWRVPRETRSPEAFSRS